MVLTLTGGACFICLFHHVDIVGSYLPCCILGLLVIFGLKVWSSGQKYSVVGFLFIRLSSFGLMDPPHHLGSKFHLSEAHGLKGRNQSICKVVLPTLNYS